MMVETPVTIKEPQKKIPYIFTKLGSDPEFFFAKKTMLGKVGSIIGAEKIIPQEGIETIGINTVERSKITIDGVQAEINPAAYTCRQACAREIASNFRVIAKLIAKKRITINWEPTVKVTKTEMLSLSPKSRMFGCSPSLNAYGEKIDQPDAETYQFRSAGGHIHIGFVYTSGSDPARDILTKEDVSDVVKILDIIVGNTCVLIDQNEGNIERRKAYGRAGEYRKPKHGIEYRVLSNFWLQNYVLMSMAFGLTRLAIAIYSLPEARKEIMEAVKEKSIREAINNNDFALATKNFGRIKPLIAKYSTNTHSLWQGNLKQFDHFICKGIKKWFKGDPLSHWTDQNFRADAGTGWEGFLFNTVQNDIPKKSYVRAKAKIS